MSMPSSSSSVASVSIGTTTPITTTVLAHHHHQEHHPTSSSNNNVKNDRSNWSIYTKCITIHPSFQYNNNTNNNMNYNNINIPTIETIWEIESNNQHQNHHQHHQQKLQQRIAIYNGPESTIPTLQISLQLPTINVSSSSYSSLSIAQEQQQEGIDVTLKNRLAWVHFQKKNSNTENNDTKTNSSSSNTIDMNHSSYQQQQEQHKVLCCLYNPNTLYIWDVFPNDNIEEKQNKNDDDDTNINIPSEGWCITLPFDCCSIYTIQNNIGGGGNNGLLLQRYEDDIDDIQVYNYNQNQNNTNNNHQINDDGFVLLGPPFTWKQKLHQSQQQSSVLPIPPIVSNSNNNTNPIASTMTTTIEMNQYQQQHHQQQESTRPIDPTIVPPIPVTSLFSLHHPLEDVIPIALLPVESPSMSLSQHKQQSDTITATITTVTDVFEQVIWIGTAEWTMTKESNHSSSQHQTQQSNQQNNKTASSTTQLMVTYHTIEQRHAIYIIENAPLPPTIPTLYEQTQQQLKNIHHSNNNNKQNNHITKNNSNKDYGPMRDVVDLSLEDDDDDDEEIDHKINNLRVETMMMDIDQNLDTNNNDDDDDIDHPNIPIFGQTQMQFIQPRRSNNNNSNKQQVIHHDIALADALGVNVIPTSTTSAATTTTSNSHPPNHLHHHHHRRSRPSVSPRVSSVMSGGNGSYVHNRNSKSIQYQQSDNATSHTRFFSPDGTIINNHNNNNHLDVVNNMNNTIASVPNHTPATADIPSGLFTSRLSNALHPKIAIRCIYKETTLSTNTPIPCATTVCLVSNTTATGTLVLALLCGETLVLYSLVPGAVPNNNSNIQEGIVRVEFLSSIPFVMSIAPVTVYPSPPKSMTPHDKNSSMWATDLLVLQKNGQCTLYRSHLAISQCDLSDNDFIDMSNVHILGLSDPVVNTYSLQLQDKLNMNEQYILRCQISLSFDNASCFTNRILSCLDAALYSSTKSDISKNIRCIQMALKLRTDCYRLFYAIQTMEHNSTSKYLPSMEQLVFETVRVVIVQIMQYKLTGNIMTPVEDDYKDFESLSSTTTDDSNSAWEALLNSDFHQKNKSLLPMYDDEEHKNGMLPIRPLKNRLECLLSSIGSLSIQDMEQNEIWNDIPLFSIVFDAIHLLYEDTKLSTSRSSIELQSLVSLLIELTSMVQYLDDRNLLKTRSFLDYYYNDLAENSEDQLHPQQHWYNPTDLSKSGKDVKHVFHWTTFAKPPSIFDWIQSTIANVGDDPVPCDTYGEKLELDKFNPVCLKTRLVLQIFSLLSCKTDNRENDMHVVQILLDGCFKTTLQIREEFCVGVALPLLEVLCRCRNIPSNDDLPRCTFEAWKLIGRQDLAMNICPNRHAMYTESSSSPIEASIDESNDGLAEVEQSAAIMFPDDNRVHEAVRLLCTSRPIFLRVTRAVDVSDHDYERLKQKRLLILSIRALAQPTGRGMLTIGRYRPIPAETLPIPDLCLKGRVPPTNATVNLDVSDCPVDMQVWPEFHNGVAAGLRLPAKDDPRHSDFILPRTWIVYNRPPINRTQVPPPQDNGDDINPVTQVQSYSHGGFLLALGLRGHLTALDMSDIYEYLTQGCATTTVGVLLGMAANKRGTCDLSVSKMLCLHIPSLIPQHFSAIDVASIVQTSAIIGAGLLFQGSSHRMMTEFLLNEIGKRPDADINTSDRESYTLACGLALGTVNLCLGETVGSDNRRAGVADLRIEERLIRYIVGGIDNDEVERTRESNDRFSLPNSSVGNDSEKCSTIYESNLINTSVTSPGATLALGLMYMKTNNKAVAGSLALPDTHFLLEFVRPDFLGFRVIARSLILWNEVKATSTWINNQVPKVVRDAYEQISVAAKASYTTRWATGNRSHVEEYDRRAIKQIYVHVVSSACFAIGLRYAGTGSLDAKAAIMERVRELHALREATDPISMAIRPEIPVLDLCLGCTAISLAMVLAGTGDLDALRIFKILRWRCDADSQYGIHMIYGMSIGMLFLAGGTCILGRDPADIAALVTAFYPRFPISTSDNQYHLQALRHLYALAVKRTELRAIDVETKESVQVRVQIKSDNNIMNSTEFQLPCLLYNSDSMMQELQVVSDSYYPLKLDLSKQNGFYSFFVKRRYGTELTNFALNSTRNDMGKNVVKMDSNTDPYLQAFSEFFCMDSRFKNGSFDNCGTMLYDPEFVSRVLTSCQANDSAEDVLPLYLSIRYGISNLQNMDSVMRTCFLRNLRLIHAYYQYRQLNSSTLSLLDTELLLPYLFELAGRQLASQTSIA